MRVPIASGVLYESDFAKLNFQIESAFEKGTGSTPLEIKDKNVKAIIVPNLSYSLSSVMSSWAYKDLAESPTPLTFIILGSLSQKSDKVLLTLQDFSTPFGIIRIDRNSVNKLLGSNSLIDEASHNSESSIELQLPLLQYVNKKNLDSLRILPILTSTLDETIIKSLALKLSKIENVIFIVSSNLLNYGPLYNFAPFKYNVKTELENLNNKILEAVLNVNFIDLLSITNKYDFNSISPILVLLEVLRLKNIRNGDILSHDLIQDGKNFVSAASIVYYEDKNK